MLRKTDGVLLYYFEKMAHWFQRLTGKNNFFLAWCCYPFWISCENYAAIFRMIEQITTMRIITFFIMNFFLVAVAVCIWYAECEHGRNPAFRNPLQANSTMYFWRILQVIMVLVGFVDLAITGKTDLRFWAILLGLATLYWASCTPLPPTTSKISKLISQFKTALTPAEALPEGAQG